jgi:hypothetical protein
MDIATLREPTSYLSKVIFRYKAIVFITLVMVTVALYHPSITWFEVETMTPVFKNSTLLIKTDFKISMWTFSFDEIVRNTAEEISQNAGKYTAHVPWTA